MGDDYLSIGSRRKFANIEGDGGFLLCCVVDHYARLGLLGFRGNGGVRGGRRAKVRPVHWEENGRSRPLQAVAHSHVHLLWRHPHLFAVLGWRLPLDPLVRLVLTVCERLAVLKSPEEPDEEAEEDERSQARDEGQALDIQAGSDVAAVEEHVPLHVAPVGAGVDVGGAPLVRQRAVVEVLERFWLLHRVDLLTRTNVLPILVWLVEYLVLPHIKVQNQDEEDDAIVEPLAYNETRDIS